MRLLTFVLAVTGCILFVQGIHSSPNHPQRKSRLATLLMMADLKDVSPTRFLLFALAVFLVTTFVAAGLLESLLPAIGAGVALSIIPFAFLIKRRDRRNRRVREAWPHALATMVAQLRSGASLAEACFVLAERGPLELRRAFRSFRSSLEAVGNFRGALEELRTELADPIADRVCTALAIADEVGGTELVPLLTTLADFVREDLRARKEIEARWSWTKNAARVAASAPGVVLLLMMTRPQAADAYASGTGRILLTLCGVATAAGYLLMLRIARLPDVERSRP